MWNASESEYRNFDDGDFVRVEGSTQLYQGALQLIATNICKAGQEEIDFGDFMPLGPAEIDRLALRLGELLRAITNPHLRNLAECFLLDEEFMRKFYARPGRREESSCLYRRTAGTRSQPDGSYPPDRRLLSSRRSRSAHDGRVCP